VNQSFQLHSLAATILALQIVTAQYPPPARFSNILKSPIEPKITVSYKTPESGTCTTIFSAQKQYTGYITLPPYTLAPIQQNYTINTFFWFIEARDSPETSPLTIWLNGGPGSSSLIGLFTENGPCEVVQMADGSYGTKARVWGWDRSSNVLYIDQPVQAGLSYDVLTNASFDFLANNISIPPTPNPRGGPSYTWLNGTFSSQKNYATANTTQIAAHAIWHFLQTFLAAFPIYNPGTRPNGTTTYPTGINLFSESYGGVYGPIFADLFEQQNNLRRSGRLSPNNSLEVRLTSLGILNGQVDFKIQAPYYAKFAYNNTYGIQLLDQTTALKALASASSPGGCFEQVDQCRALMDAQDPQAEGDVKIVNNSCESAFLLCLKLQNAAGTSGRSLYDIRQKNPPAFPSAAYFEYLNTEQVQKSIGTPINYTESNIISDTFVATGDILRGTQLPALARLVQRGVRVALLYGDADFICNWQGGEAVSLSLASMLPSYTDAFPAAGYADIVVNNSYIGGAIRQYGNLSFARIYDSGHLIPAYQPETAFTVFTRIVQGTALSTGENIDLSSYRTAGPAFSTKTNSKGSSLSPVCWVRPAKLSCTPEQLTAMLGGQGVVFNGVWYASQSDYKPPSTSVVAGKPGTPAPNATSWSMAKGSSTVAPTGVYVATGTPKPSFAVKGVILCWEVLAASMALVIAMMGGWV
jgi:carboxypeptidase C (cathepsin A)